MSTLDSAAENGMRVEDEVVSPKAGVCFSCGYSRQYETDCPTREDHTHCEHWWDGPDTVEARERSWHHDANILQEKLKAAREECARLEREVRQLSGEEDYGN